MKQKTLPLIILLLITVTYANSQSNIKLKNPSFEEIENSTQLPSVWQDCGMENQSPPDI